MKLSVRLQQEREFVQRALDDKTICSRCDATLKSFAACCPADLGEACEGYVTIENARTEFNRQSMAIER